ncbi:MAG: N-acetylmuramoyl-L-alanine amidase [Anaerolineae bacterium]|nr:N-acetylmuramoyl-L-alanine amidase [Thermoflexales bacterium]MDW8406963.1 N-acetylmuramoyl-L-alanine amidase [Anaerolineae bacterium]
MKKPSRLRKSKTASGVHRAAVRRAQPAGKQQAARQTRRLARAQPAENAPSLERVGAASITTEVPFAVRRIFAIALIAVALVLIGALTAQNWAGFVEWASALARTQQATAAPSGITANPAQVARSDIRIGIVSGHRGSDSGAVCADGLTEAQVNFDHAMRVASLLRAQGYTVDVLEEFDPRLEGYTANVLVSIHADSCTYINDLATGFKVARVLDSRLPEVEDRLVACLKSRYQQATGLRFHANTVTYDMTQYHAFYEIASTTPAAIIETGFLYLDRIILTRKPERVAEGIVNGILCFLNQETP